MISLQEIKRIANDNCWKNDVDKKVKSLKNRLKMLEDLPDSFSKNADISITHRIFQSAIKHQKEIHDFLTHSHLPRTHYQCISSFHRLNPDKGYLRLIRVIMDFNLKGIKPTRNDCSSYAMIKYGSTYKMVELFAALHKMGFCEYDKGWSVTDLGKELLQRKHCIA